MPLFHNANNYYKIAQYPANIKNFGNNGLLKTSSVLIYLTFMEKNWKMEKFYWVRNTALWVLNVCGMNSQTLWSHYFYHRTTTVLRNICENQV